MLNHLLCFLRLHAWTRWIDAALCTRTALTQYRFCHRCGAYEWR